VEPQLVAVKVEPWFFQIETLEWMDLRTFLEELLLFLTTLTRAPLLLDNSKT